MKLPPTITGAIRDSVMLSDGSILLARRAIREAEAARFPELVIENNIGNIREAALTTMRCLLLTTNYMQLFSFDELYSEALNQLADRTKELEDDLLTELPNAASDQSTDTALLDTGTITVIENAGGEDAEYNCFNDDDAFDDGWWDD